MDPVTNWGWIFASPAADWFEAKTLCTGEGYQLPNHPVIGHAARRIWASPLGTLLYQADSRRAWTSENFDLWSAMAVFFPGGDAGSVNKRQLFPVLCVKKP